MSKKTRKKSSKAASPQDGPNASRGKDGPKSGRNDLGQNSQRQKPNKTAAKAAAQSRQDGVARSIA